MWIRLLDHAAGGETPRYVNLARVTSLYAEPAGPYTEPAGDDGPAGGGAVDGKDVDAYAVLADGLPVFRGSREQADRFLRRLLDKLGVYDPNGLTQA